MIGIRPEHFVPAGTGDCGLHVAIDVAEHLGATSYLYADTRTGEPMEAEGSNLAPAGLTIAVSIPAAQALVFDAQVGRLR